MKSKHADRIPEYLQHMTSGEDRPMRGDTHSDDLTFVVGYSVASSSTYSGASRSRVPGTAPTIPPDCRSNNRR